MNFFTKAAGILGMNARNLLYIARYNSTDAKQFADDKLFTKRYLESRGIGVARLYRVIRSERELYALNPTTLPPNFVMKPNRGYGGEGIIVISGRRGERFVGVSGREYTWAELSAEADAILAGKYAISGVRDTVLFEERLEPHGCFAPILEVGLPDIRVIVFNLVPVIAMLRLPTHASEGKANLHLGAIGIGVDIATGRTTYAVAENRFVRELPGGIPTAGFQIPEWETILTTASHIQKITNIGYLAVDFALTRTGVKVLEVNARAGLSVQIASRVPLRARLEKVADLRVTSVEQGVTIAKTIFGAPKPPAKPATTRPVIGLFESVSLLTADGETPLRAKIDLHATENLIATHLPLPENGIAEISLKDRRLTLPFRATKLVGAELIILSGKAVADFLVDPTMAAPAVELVKSSTKRDEALLIALDKKLCQIDASLKLLSRVRPTNLAEARLSFLRQPTQSPHFIYRAHTLDLDGYERELAHLPHDIVHPLLPLFLKKIREVDKKIALIRAVGTADFPARSAALFGSVSDAERRQAEQFLGNTIPTPDPSPRVSLPEAVARFEAALKKYNLTGWHIRLIANTATRMQVDKHHTILIAETADFTENQIAALIAHEIETHIFRTENGKRQKYELFARGTAGYLFTEEGLAVWNQQRLDLPLGEKMRVPALLIIALHRAARASFVDVFRMLRETYGVDEEEAWRLTVKVKRGLTDTSQPGALTKDRAYFVGWREVEHFLRSEKTRAERLHKLYAGKLTTQDLKTLSFDSLITPRWLPDSAES